MKIFWSWQSDTPGKTGRFVVRDALHEAIKDLQTVTEIEEPTLRETREALHLDHDIQGVEGSPDLVPTIFAKIDKAAVFIADVTLVGEAASRTRIEGTAPSVKKFINSNVAIELGYGLRALSDRKVLLVFNEHYGRHEDLPFDLRHKGGAIVFNLAPDASKSIIDSERRKLKSQFSKRLESYIAARTATAPLLEETPATFNKAAYFSKGETLAQIGDPDSDQIDYCYDTENLCYLRLIPTVRPTRPFTLPQLRDAVGSAPLLHRTSSSLIDTNSHGAIKYDPANNPPRGIGKLKGSTQVFENGEVWSIAEKLIVRYAPVGYEETIRVPFVPSLAFEAAYFDALWALINFAKTRLGGSLPWTIEAGVIGLRKTYLAVGSEQWAFKKEAVVVRNVLSAETDQAVGAFLLSFFSAVFDATGYSRPDRLHGFPPNPPR